MYWLTLSKLAFVFLKVNVEKNISSLHTQMKEGTNIVQPGSVNTTIKKSSVIILLKICLPA